MRRSARARSLSNGEIVKQIDRLLGRPQRLLEFAQRLCQDSSNEAIEIAANEAVKLIGPLVQQVFGDGAILTLQGSRAKGTHLEDSDFDYHIEGLGRAITLDEMYSLKFEIDRNPTTKDIVKTHRTIRLALTVISSGREQFIIEIVPENPGYVDEEARGTIEKATPFFRNHQSACNVVRVLKHMFSRTGQRLKNYEIEAAVQELHGLFLGTALQQREPEATHDLFCHTLEHIEDQAENPALSNVENYRGMAKLLSKLAWRSNRFASPERRDVLSRHARSPTRQENASAENIMLDREQILACLRTAIQSKRGPLRVREVYFLSLGRDPTKEQMGADLKSRMNRILTDMKSQNAIISVDGLWSLPSSNTNSSSGVAMPDEEQIIACLQSAADSGRGPLPVREIYLMSLGRDPKKDQMGSGVRAKMERILKNLQSRNAVSRDSGQKEWSTWSLQI